MSVPKYKGIEKSKPATAFALLMVDGLKLLIPRNEIRSLVSVEDIQNETEQKMAIASVTFENTVWPVYCLSNQLSPLNSIPITRRVCVILHSEEQQIGLLCDQIQNIGLQTTQALKPCMQLSDTPIIALSIHENTVACATTTAVMVKFLGVHR